MQLPKTSGLAVWLLPACDQSRLFKKFISILSEQYNTISFVPHVTLSSVPDIPAVKIVELTDQFSKHVSPLNVDIGKIECRAHPYRKVIMPIDEDVVVQAFKNEVNNGFGGSFLKKNDFHLSLLYGNQKCGEIDVEKIRRDVPRINKLHIKRVAVVDLNFTPDNWKIIFERSL